MGLALKRPSRLVGPKDVKPNILLNEGPVNNIFIVIWRPSNEGGRGPWVHNVHNVHIPIYGRNKPTADIIEVWIHNDIQFIHTLTICSTLAFSNLPKPD